VSTATAAPPPQRQHVLYLDWPDVEGWLTGRLRRVWRDGRAVALAPAWAPGQHWALVGPTGEGKSTFAVALMRLRKYVLALDPKGADETLAASGYERISGGLPPRKRFPRKIQRDLDEGRVPVRLIIGFEALTDDEDDRLRAMMAEAITYARRAGAWCLYVDEFEVLSSQRMFRLGPVIERMLITARRKKTSVITAFQAPAWVSKHSTRQATFCVLFPTRALDMIKQVAESMGRDWRTVAAIVDELPPFHALIIPKSHRHPMVICSAPELTLAA
jgi:hypothetical protein